MGCFHDLLGGLLFAPGWVNYLLFFFASMLVPIRGQNIMNKRIHHLNFNCAVRIGGRFWLLKLLDFIQQIL